MAAKRIRVGVIGRPHGVRGLVHVHAYAERDLASYGRLTDDRGRAWTLAWRGSGIAELRDPDGRPLADRTEAERLVNQNLYVERAQLAEPGDDEFYLADLVGLEASTAEGEALGPVTQVHDYGAGASLELTDGRLIPFTKAAVPHIDLSAGRLTVVLPDEVELAPSRAPPALVGAAGAE